MLARDPLSAVPPTFTSQWLSAGSGHEHHSFHAFPLPLLCRFAAFSNCVLVAKSHRLRANIQTCGIRFVSTSHGNFE